MQVYWKYKGNIGIKVCDKDALEEEMANNNFLNNKLCLKKWKMLKARRLVLQLCVKIIFTWIYLLDGGQNAKRNDESEQRDRVA